MNVEDRLLDLDSIAIGIPIISVDAAGFYKENCMVCFDNQGHKSGVNLKVEYGDTNNIFSVAWSGSITNRLILAYRDLRRATDHAACAIALLLMPEITEFTAVEQAVIGTSFDYYLSPKADEETLIFNHAARLEVSGILRESATNTISSRVNQKKRRLKPNESLPAFIVVVEFGKPESRVVRA